MSHLYYQSYLPDSLTPDPAIYDAIMADINTIPPDTYVAVVAGFAIDLRNYWTSPICTRWRPCRSY